MFLSKVWSGNKRILIIAAIMVALAAQFWSGSRYPSLSAKAMMGGETMLEDPLSFESALEIHEGDSLGKRIVYITINWASTNRRGMTFGVLFGAAFLTLLGMLKRRSTKNGFVNTLIGMFTGTPLGVCVNCAAPIAKGMHDAGARLETTLATMISSPTLNVVVLTMLFSVFPIYLAVTKVALTLVFILVLIPLMSRYVFSKETMQTAEGACCIMDPIDIPGNESWKDALVSTVKLYLKSLWYIIYKTVPLMLLAGFLGAVIVSLIPLESFTDIEPNLLVLIGLALLGVFLPVPIAFDIIVCAALLTAGVPIVYVMVLLFTLGTYSIYSFFIVWTSISRRVAMTLFAAVAVLGIIGGYAAQHYHEWEIERMLNVFGSEAQAADNPPAAFKVEVSKQREFAARKPVQDRPFTRLEGRTYGINRPNDFSVADFWPPWYNGRGVASGDYNNDGFADLVLATENGIQLYRNDAGKGFVLEPLKVAGLDKLDSFVVALVDIDNDGWLDIFVTSYRDDNHYLLNDKGNFAKARLQRAPKGEQVLTYSMSFGDLDRDGDLDAAVGNWFYGFAKPVPPPEGVNVLYINDGGKLSSRQLPGMAGETLSILLSDFNNDDKLDLMVGNDFVQPDIFYLGDGAGGLRMLQPKDGIIPVSTTTTMSMDTADVDNDLVPEIYVAQIAARAAGAATRQVQRKRSAYCSDISDEDKEAKQRCLTNVEIRNQFRYGAKHEPAHIQRCKALKEPGERRACMAMMILKTAVGGRRQELCNRIPETEERTRHLCNNFFKPSVKPTKADYKASIPQKKNQNVFLVPTADGKFVDRAEQMGVDITAWSWNAKFADVNNDGWQDAYVVNGTWLRDAADPSNYFFFNNQGKGFSNRTRDYGLPGFMVVSAYTFVDIENDGDLDIITNSTNGPMWVYRNNEAQNNAIAFELRDLAGNRFGIGSKVIIHYGKDGAAHQVRELKSGGGFMSFDAPLVHFGLGKHERVAKVEVIWSTGERSVVATDLAANALYRIQRSRGG